MLEEHGEKHYHDTLNRSAFLQVHDGLLVNTRARLSWIFRVAAVSPGTATEAAHVLFAREVAYSRFTLHGLAHCEVFPHLETGSPLPRVNATCLQR